MSKCRECKVPIVFVRMADTGKLMPCNPGTDIERGNVACSRSGALYINGYVITEAQPLADGFVPLLAHWATCTKPSRRKPAATPTTKRQPADPALF